jgi:hypothetical protein
MTARFLTTPSRGLNYLSLSWRWLIALMLFTSLVACGGSDDAPVTPPATMEPTPQSLSMEKIAGYTHAGGVGASEISAFDPISRRLFVVNGIQKSVDVLGMVSTGTGASSWWPTKASPTAIASLTRWNWIFLARPSPASAHSATKITAWLATA